jgi:hypothetical protein
MNRREREWERGRARRRQRRGERREEKIRKEKELRTKECSEYSRDVKKT